MVMFLDWYFTKMHKSNNKILILLLAFFFKKMLILYILLNFLAIPRIIYLIAYKKPLNTKKIIDSTIIKIFMVVKQTTFYEKIDLTGFFMLSYLTIFWFHISIKSLTIAITFIKHIDYSFNFEHVSLKNIIIKTYKEEFLINLKVHNIGGIYIYIPLLKKKIIIDVI